MYSLVFDFNLKLVGSDVESYITEIAQEWPSLYSSVRGYKGTVFLANGFGLAGKYTFRQIIDIESLATLGALEEAYRSPQWKYHLATWHRNRSEVQSRLLRHDQGDEDFINKTIKGSTSSTIVYTVSFSRGASKDTLDKSFEKIRSSAANNLSSRVYSAVIQSEGHHGFETWNSMADLASIDALADIASSIEGADITTQLYGLIIGDDIGL